LAKNVIKHLDKWMPAKIDGKEAPAIKKFQSIPMTFFEKYKEGYSLR
jgi:hypothetical protein